jgi:3-oxoacyl-[acyl-carrier protein] reductase
MTAPRKVALVTGSATGAGRAIALRFAAQGLAVAVNYSRSEAEAKDTSTARPCKGDPDAARCGEEAATGTPFAS